MDEMPIGTFDYTGQPRRQTMMKLYKFRSLKPFRFVEDIIVNQRFYMTPIAKLNDPMEGVFHAPGFSDGFRRAMQNANKQWRVCSFSRCYTSPLCWAHYADGFRGICIEIESYSNCINWHPVTYKPSRIVIGEGNAYAVSMLTSLLLTYKLEDWKYEQEVRAIEPEYHEYLPGKRLWTMKRVLLGVSTSPKMRKEIRRITPDSVQVWTTKINDQDCIEIDTGNGVTSRIRNYSTVACPSGGTSVIRVRRTGRS